MAGGGEDRSTVLHEKLALPKDINSARMSACGLLLASIVPNTLASLVRLNILEVLAAAGEGARLTVEELAQLAMPGKSISVKYLERLLRLVSCKQILREVVTIGVDGQVERRFRMDQVGKFFVDSAETGSFINFLHLSLYPLALSYDTMDKSVVDDTLNAFERAHVCQ